MRFLEKLLKKFIKQTFIRPVTNSIKGWSGEKSTALSMWLSLDDKTYKKFHDVIISSSNGTAQLDHIIVSRYGVFIVETKNKSGWIFGSEEQANWTQIIFKEKYSFQNPLKQMYRQKKVLSEFLGVSSRIIHSVVYFVGDCEFKTQMPPNVVTSGLSQYLKTFEEKVLSEDETEKIVKIIEQHLAESKLTNLDHLNSLASRHSSKTICPRCGGNLISRIVKKGPNEGKSFLGCKNYPQCHFTRDM